jgi:hypothetical protein
MELAKKINPRIMLVTFFVLFPLVWSAEYSIANVLKAGKINGELRLSGDIALSKTFDFELTGEDGSTTAVRFTADANLKRPKINSISLETDNPMNDAVGHSHALFRYVVKHCFAKTDATVNRIRVWMREVYPKMASQGQGKYIKTIDGVSLAFRTAFFKSGSVNIELTAKLPLSEFDKLKNYCVL